MLDRNNETDYRIRSEPPTKHDAINSLVDDAVFMTSGFGAEQEIMEWESDDIVQPTAAAITAEWKRLVAIYDAKLYARKRRSVYPEIGEQLNKIYDDGIEKWKTEMIDPIKAANPKP